MKKSPSGITKNCTPPHAESASERTIPAPARRAAASRLRGHVIPLRKR